MFVKSTPLELLFRCETQGVLLQIVHYLTMNLATQVLVQP